eukprot:TRINITY_DN8261_c0_g1_i1.p1 TRINITY_DN8261_c0_g1~~TRINITY_DN8261_c0_g1_i1.p1  ORF type:complete len:419 (-),score=66.07 TRINITY_DN8261_c0_g1_i1:180-1436(-)
MVTTPVTSQQSLPLSDISAFGHDLEAETPEPGVTEQVQKAHSSVSCPSYAERSLPLSDISVLGSRPGQGTRRHAQKGKSGISLSSYKSYAGSLYSLADVASSIEPTYRRIAHIFKEHPRLVCACAVMLGAGVAVGMAVQGWSFLTSLYVVVQIVTTIGYGDVTVSHWTMQLFMSIWVLLLLVIMARFLEILTRAVIQQHVARFQSKLRKHAVSAGHSQSTRLCRVTDLVTSSSLFIVALAAGTLFYRFAESCTCSYGVTKRSGCRDDSYDVCVETGGFRHDWISSFYMSIITITTVGFGDYTPRSELGRCFALLWMTGGVAATGSFIQAVSRYIDAPAELPGAECIDEQIFKAIDKNKDGYLSKAEYTRYILLKHNFLPREVLAEIDDKYDAMDEQRTGRVTLKMLQQRAYTQALGRT